MTGASLTPVTLTRTGQEVGAATADWGGTRRTVPVVASAAATLVGIPGQRIEQVLAPVPGRRSDRIGSLRATLGTEAVVVPLARRHVLVTPDWIWRLVHG